ncbi:MAG: phosphoribosylformylglycinamidine synthase subunit PurQ [Firmicutes bacterium]|nr:phosphoribosylformylglycinamidine synthase subunit PurQ [Bacillota bacterium]
MKFGIVVFPGSNCEADCYYVIDKVLGENVEYIWHQQESVDGFDGLVLPGGFSYGDYLRTGAIARFSPVMNAVERFAKSGGLVIGICNGFQILLEAGLLPGAMQRNKVLQFRCQPTQLRVERSDTPFSNLCRERQVLTVPINHGEGNYYADPDSLAELEANRQVVFRYCTPGGEAAAEANPNGAVNNIAGIVNREGNVLGMMPHPERCSESVLGSSDGRLIFASLVEWWKGGGAVVGSN